MKFPSFILSLLTVLVVLYLFGGVLAIPNGAGVTFINSSGPSGGNTSNSSVFAIAGNLTEIILNTDGAGGGSASQTWSGYYGNVTGGITVGDGSSNQFFNWSSSTPLGEVFASVNSSLIWTNIQCFNFTANGSFFDDSTNRGNTSLYGLNVTQLHAQYGIDSSDADSANATFSLLNNHSQFYVNNLEFSANECPSAHMLNSTGQGAFEEVLLYSPDNRNVVFTAIINQDTVGFDGRPHDFQMLVLENGHGVDTNSTSYYFYLEIG